MFDNKCKLMNKKQNFNFILNDCNCIPYDVNRYGGFEINNINIKDLDDIFEFDNYDKIKSINLINESKLFNIDYNKMNGRPSILLNINDKKYVWCLLDTGAKINVILEDLINKIEGKIKYSLSDIHVTCANDSSLKILGYINLKIKLNRIEVEEKFYIARQINPSMIAGIDLLEKLGIRLIMNDFYSKDNMYVNQISIESVAIKKLIQEYDSIFMKHKWDIGVTKLTKHEIKTEGGPIVVNPRRQPMHLQSKIEENIREMEAAGIIKKCESRWNSPLVCVLKKNKKDIRICLDFRALNDITERPCFPIPNIEEMLDTL